MLEQARVITKQEYDDVCAIRLHKQSLPKEWESFKQFVINQSIDKEVVFSIDDKNECATIYNLNFYKNGTITPVDSNTVVSAKCDFSNMAEIINNLCYQI